MQFSEFENFQLCASFHRENFNKWNEKSWKYVKVVNEPSVSKFLKIRVLWILEIFELYHKKTFPEKSVNFTKKNTCNGVKYLIMLEPCILFYCICFLKMSFCVKTYHFTKERLPCKYLLGGFPNFSSTATITNTFTASERLFLEWEFFWLWLR